MELAGTRAIVTGGASGIGEACVAQLRPGRGVAVLDLADAREDDFAFSVDVSRRTPVVAGIADAAQVGWPRCRDPDAGVGGGSPLLELTTAEWERVMSVNLRGAFVTLRGTRTVMTGAARSSW